MNNQELLFASLVGRNILKLAPVPAKIENEISKHVLPAIPFLPIQNKENVSKFEQKASLETWVSDAKKSKENQYFPLSLSIDNRNWFLLPYEPIISIAGKNNIIRRYPAKSDPIYSKGLKGSIKEYWSQDDYEITITGVLMGSLMTGKPEDCYPKEDFEMLKEFLTYAGNIKVKSFPLEKTGINRIVIEDFSFPFTKGENVQAYLIKAYSDNSFNLLNEVES